MSHPPEDPFRPILREIAVVAAVLLIVLYLAACAAVPESTPKPAFPADMRLVCHEGAYHLGSVSADQVVRLPLSCS